MSVNLALLGVPGNPVTATASTAETDIFAPTAVGGAVYNVIGFDIVNTDGSARAVNLFWSDGTTSFQFYGNSVAATTSVTKTDNLIPLVPAATSGNLVAKKITCTAAASSVVKITTYYSVLMPQATR